MPGEYRIRSINRPLLESDVFRPIMDEVAQEYGAEAIQPFKEENLRMHLVRGKLLDAVPPMSAASPQKFEQDVRDFMPPSFSRPLYRQGIRRIVVFTHYQGYVMFADFEPGAELKDEYVAAKALGQLAAHPPEERQGFRFRIALGAMSQPLPRSFRRHLAGIVAPAVDLAAGEVFVRSGRK